MVGFAPYRLRTIANGSKIPEVLPLGTFAWSVTRNQASLPRPWMTPVHTTSSAKKKTINTGDDTTTAGATGAAYDHGPLLRYDVTTTYTDEPPRVYAFCTPSPLFVCCSAMATLVQPYLMLCNKRQCVVRADIHNSKPALVFEQTDKANINQAAEQGGGMRMSDEGELQGIQRFTRNNIADRQKMHYEILQNFNQQTNLPDDTVTVVAPINHNVHGMDKTLSPQDVHREELGFIRLVAVAMGIPPVMLLQASAVIGTAAVSTSSSTQGWADSSESCNRQVLQSCYYIIEHLEFLLTEAYEAAYPGSQNTPEFQFCPVPTISLEHILSVYDAKIFDDDVFSRILKVLFSLFLSFVYGWRATFVCDEKDDDDDGGGGGGACRPHGAQNWAWRPRTPVWRRGRPNSSCPSRIKKTIQNPKKDFKFLL